VSFNIGIAGATGEVTLRVLEERRIPVGKLRLFASTIVVGRLPDASMRVRPTVVSALKTLCGQ